ncbi:MAG TPA: hypothetical protein VGM41_07600 [Chitinophagaceae bacterium]|jgi:hypothetical protein
MTLMQRIMAATPPFFTKLRNIGLVLATISTTIATAPLALPAIVTKIAGYLAVAAGIASAVSQAAVHDEPKSNPS